MVHVSPGKTHSAAVMLPRGYFCCDSCTLGLFSIFASQSLFLLFGTKKQNKTKKHLPLYNLPEPEFLYL